MPRQMASMPEQNVLTVVDVYDIAASIGKEFEKIIEGNGAESVAELMPKVINVLEHLEDLASRNQQENNEISELKFAVERLQSEKAARAEERAKYERELEQIEESWRTETKELLDSVAQLQDENRRMRNALQEKEGQETKIKETEDKLTMLVELRDLVHKQRDQIRILERDIQNKTVDFEAMQSQMERLARLNLEYRQRTELTQQRAQGLIQEKVDLQAQLLDKEHQIVHIKDRIRDGGSQPASPTILAAELQGIAERLEQEGKMVIDLNDPHRPRFTLNELRDVLQERNKLKSELMEVQAELKDLKPPEPSPGDPDEDLPVQGPINREPDEKLYPERFSKQESGIRKFFHFLVSPSEKSKKRSHRPVNAQPVKPISTYSPLFAPRHK